MIGEEISAERFILMARNLADIPEPELLEAIDQWSKYCPRFPKPSELRDAAKGIIPGQPRRIRNRENWQ